MQALYLCITIHAATASRMMSVLVTPVRVEASVRASKSACEKSTEMVRFERSFAHSAADLQALHERRLRRILDVAAVQGAEAIVLGAFGCGAFRNDPKVVAAAAKAVVADYLHAFRAIEFAVYCRPGDSANFDAFVNA